MTCLSLTRCSRLSFYIHSSVAFLAPSPRYILHCPIIRSYTIMEVPEAPETRKCGGGSCNTQVPIASKNKTCARCLANSTKHRQKKRARDTRDSIRPPPREPFHPRPTPAQSSERFPPSHQSHSTDGKENKRDDGHEKESDSESEVPKKRKKVRFCFF